MFTIHVKMRLTNEEYFLKRIQPQLLKPLQMKNTDNTVKTMITYCLATTVQHVLSLSMEKKKLKFRDYHYSGGPPLAFWYL